MRIRNFTGKNVFIVGGSSGIGLAAAMQMAARGAHITIFARRLDVLREAAEQITAACISSEQRVEYGQLDAADPQQVDHVMEAAVSELDTPDVLINCAGRALPDHFPNISRDQLGETLALNLATCWNTTAALVPRMQVHGGYIVNTSSMAGLIGVYGYSDYCAAKFAVVGFSEALRSELKRHDVTVSVLCPPDTDTPALAREDQNKPAETRALSGRPMSPEVVGQALLRGMARGRFLIVPGAQNRLAVLAKRLVPGLVERIIDRRIASARRVDVP